MNKKSYHHGNLNQAMIDAGIELINEKGADGFSLRKVAERCGVSHSAPYKHFKNKDDLIAAMQAHVTNSLAEYLQNARSRCRNKNKVLIELGKSYICYFVENPAYHHFLFSQPSFHMRITDTKILCDDFPPFSILQAAAREKLTDNHVLSADHGIDVLVMWSVVEGLTSILVSNNVFFEGDYLSAVERILKEKINL
ncbi:TetR/AcrR family transcriptional regulator [Clostridium luticellarii]|jgi:AcrR family transcriptional regulator|uniref:Tetracycline repressor protein class H n=2 Tax=Clostridium TaxID=1485 RepID=A0A2T0BLF5_9CLOT|nr:TetR/AcrR family transcriptional regulator [Clostridium luticellarii]PRR84711.1 Tetracycline repressor protein class H [Clostridium luticellarii]